MLGGREKSDRLPSRIQSSGSFAPDSDNNEKTHRLSTINWFSDTLSIKCGVLQHVFYPASDVRRCVFCVKTIISSRTSGENTEPANRVQCTHTPVIEIYNTCVRIHTKVRVYGVKYFYHTRHRGEKNSIAGNVRTAATTSFWQKDAVVPSVCVARANALIKSDVFFFFVVEIYARVSIPPGKVTSFVRFVFSVKLNLQK